MKIMPINNVNTQNTQFKAKFPKRDVSEFLREAKGCDVDTIPVLYTMLDIIKQHPGKEAAIEHSGLWHRILIDGKSINDDNKYFCAFHALRDAVVKSNNSLLKNKETQIKRLSEEDFENAYYQNRKKTTKDIEKIFEE